MEGVAAAGQVQRAGLGQAAVLLFEQVQDVVAGVGAELLGVGDRGADGGLAVDGHQLKDTGEVVAGVHAAFLQAVMVGGGLGAKGEEAQLEPLAFAASAFVQLALVVGILDDKPAAGVARVFGHQDRVGVEAQGVAGELQGQERTGVLRWHGVAVGLDADAAAPGGAHAQGTDRRIRLRVQRQQLGALQREGVEGALAGLGVDAHVGDGVQPQAHGGGELGEGADLPAVQEAALHIVDRVFHDALGLRMRGGAGLDLEAVVAGEVEVLGVEDRRGAGAVREHRGLAVVDQHFAGHAAEGLEGTLVAPQPPFLRLAQRKLDVQPAAVRQDQDEEAQGAPGAVDLDGAEAAPVDLGALAGGEAQREAGLRL